jgi:hypothetical protein
MENANCHMHHILIYTSTLTATQRQGNWDAAAFGVNVASFRSAGLF